MATPIVIQLRQDALDKDVAVSDLLRKAKLVASKLDLNDALEWIELELKGYNDTTTPIPSYRSVYGEPRCFNPYRGWIPMLFTADDETQSSISKMPLGAPIAEFEHTLESPRSETGQLMVPFHPGVISVLAKAFEIEPTKMSLFIGYDKLRGVVEAVRNKIFDWALSLEKAGIKGDGASFSPKEKEMAKGSSVTYNIGSIANFAGNLGPASDQATVATTQTNVYGFEDLRRILDQIKRYRDQLDLSKARREELDGHVSIIEDELSKPKPDGAEVKERFGAVKRIAEGVMGNVVAEGVVALITRIPWDSLPF